MPELVTAYFLSHGHWTVIPHQLEESFKDMRDCGFNSVAISFSESEMRYSRRAFEIQVNLAHKCGFKCFAIPSRIGGRLAGAPLMASTWLAIHPSHAVPDEFWMPLACLESKEFQEWSMEFVGSLVRDYDIDGVIWDEPKGSAILSHHPATLSLCAQPTKEFAENALVQWLSGMTQKCLQIKPELCMTLFVTKWDSEYFTNNAAAISGIKYFGYDGNFTTSSYFHEESQNIKYRLSTVWDRTVKECKIAGKKTFALVENMLMPADGMDDYEKNLDAYLDAHLPDQLAFYYYGHNNEDPERVHEITRKLMKKYL